MSLVGTRPILQDELLKYELHHRARIAIKPGITGMWQVSGRSDITDFEEVVRLDTEYISKVLSLGSKKYVASADNVKFRPFRRIWRINEIRKVCKRNHIKILHYNADCAADMTNIIGAKLGGVQYITIHSHNAGFGAAGKGIRFISKILKPFSYQVRLILNRSNNRFSILIQ